MAYGARIVNRLVFNLTMTIFYKFWYYSLLYGFKAVFSISRLCKIEHYIMLWNILVKMFFLCAFHLIV